MPVPAGPPPGVVITNQDNWVAKVRNVAGFDIPRIRHDSAPQSLPIDLWSNVDPTGDEIFIALAATGTDPADWETAVWTPLATGVDQDAQIRYHVLLAVAVGANSDLILSSPGTLLDCYVQVHHAGEQTVVSAGRIYVD